MSSWWDTVVKTGKEIFVKPGPSNELNIKGGNNMIIQKNDGEVKMIINQVKKTPRYDVGGLKGLMDAENHRKRSGVRDYEIRTDNTLGKGQYKFNDV